MSRPLPGRIASTALACTIGLLAACADPVEPAAAQGRTSGPRPEASEPVASPDRDARTRLGKQAARLRKAMRRGDFRYVVDRMPSWIVEQSGGREALLRASEAATDGTRQIAANMTIRPVGTIHRVGDRLVSVVAYESSLELEGQHHDMRACWIALSDDGGSSWSFVSGSKAARESLAELAPDVYAAIEDEIVPVTIPGLGSVR